MTNKDNTNNKFLLEEYRQCYEKIKQNNRAADSKEAILTVAAFGIIALVIGKDFSLGYIVGAMFVSIAFYFYILIACERNSYYSYAYRERLKEIEGEINKLKNLLMDKYSIRMQTNLAEYAEKTSNKNIKYQILRGNPSDQSVTASRMLVEEQRLK